MSGLTRWTGFAPAKVNLLLRVLAREESGYHQIETVFQALELSDALTLERVADPGVHLEVTGVPEGALGPVEENLAVRAARAYLEAVPAYLGAAPRPGPGSQLGDVQGGTGAPVPGGLAIRLEKRIPHAAGLGGGSSDAAAVLRGLDALHGHPIGRAGLVGLGSGLGADVAFFVLGTARALGWGRGDRLMPLPALPQREVVLALPPEGISTPLAYRLLAERPRTAWGGGALLSREELLDWEGVAARAENAFEAVLEPTRPELGRLRRALTEAGAAPALLSGSGSAVFGVFADADAAREAEALVRARVPDVRTLRTRTIAAGFADEATSS